MGLIANVNEALKKTFMSDQRKMELSNEPPLEVSISSLTPDGYGGALMVNGSENTEFNCFNTAVDQNTYQNCNHNQDYQPNYNSWN